MTRTAIYLTLDDKGDSEILQWDLTDCRLGKINGIWSVTPPTARLSGLLHQGPHLIHNIYFMVRSGGCKQCQVLGVDISSNLNWNTYVNRIAASANKSLRFLLGVMLRPSSPTSEK